MKQLLSMLRKHCESCAPSLLDKFDAVFDAEDRDVGFIVNERIINIPPQISPPSFDALRCAVSSAIGRMSQGDHFPDHMKFPEFCLAFPVEASKITRYRVFTDII